MRIIALCIVLLITYLSNTPDLMVSNIHTWFNPSHYENLGIKDIFKKGSAFFLPWTFTTDPEFYLHKFAHFVFYGSLSFFIFWRSSSNKKILLKLILISGFAFLDEVHQFFVVGRSGRIIDFLFDMSNILMLLLLLIIYGKIKKEPGLEINQIYTKEPSLDKNCKEIKKA